MGTLNKPILNDDERITITIYFAQVEPIQPQALNNNELNLQRDSSSGDGDSLRSSMNDSAIDDIIKMPLNLRRRESVIGDDIINELHERILKARNKNNSDDLIKQMIRQGVLSNLKAYLKNADFDLRVSNVYNAIKDALSTLKNPNSEMRHNQNRLPQNLINKINNLTEKGAIDLLYSKPSRISALCCCGFFREYNPAETYLNSVGVTKELLLSHQEWLERPKEESIEGIKLFKI